LSIIFHKALKNLLMPGGSLVILDKMIAVWSSLFWFFLGVKKETKFSMRKAISTLFDSVFICLHNSCITNTIIGTKR
jgi:hypothetical protein